MFISIGVRFEANVEALNMVETAGNYSKHRRVPYIIEEDGKLKTIYVPAISGESLGHAYQELLVKESKALNLPVCEDCEKFEFFKSMNKKYLEKKIKPVPKDDKKKIEEAIIKSCVIEDVGGFLYAEKPPVKRTSAFQFSYALPIKSIAIYATTEPQLHARHAQTGEGKKEGVAEQMIYYVETGTAVYGFTFNIDLDAIGISGLTNKAVVDEDSIKKRREASLKAIFRMLSSQQFGAKLSRFFPVGNIMEVAIAITEHPFSVTSPIYDNYMEKTEKRLKVIADTFGEETKFITTDGEKTPEECLAEMINYVKDKNII
jgi:CRISPR-associated protein Csa2